MELFQQYLPISSGTTEHMCINADGPLCYCGNHGCLETYCSANALEHTSGLPIKDFFVQLREIITTGLAGGLLTP
ncbi:ROK family protein, partial [Roseburia inulinivorans]